MSSETFLRRDDALRWSRLAELSVDRNETPVSARIGRLTKLGDMVKLHIEDMTTVGKPPRRSKAATLDMLRRELGAIKITALDRERRIQFRPGRSEADAGPVAFQTPNGAIKSGGACRPHTRQRGRVHEQTVVATTGIPVQTAANRLVTASAITMGCIWREVGPRFSTEINSMPCTTTQTTQAAIKRGRVSHPAGQWREHARPCSP